VRTVGLIVTAALSVSLLATSTASARTVRLTCHDGDPQVLQEGRPIPGAEATCDPVADGVCTFTVRVPVGPCGCPTTGCCGAPMSFRVAVKRKGARVNGVNSLR